MKRPTRYGIAACSLMMLMVLVPAPSTAQQDKSARPSPPGTAAFKFDDGKAITVNYSRPKVRGRKIYGELVPYGEVWRAGANEATSLVTQANLQVGGTAVPAGSYTLYILPQQSGPWKLVISKKTGQWGVPYPGEGDDLARIDMKTTKTPAAVEDFTIAFEKRGPNAGVMNFDWENTRTSIDFSESNK
jgi:hypothetical protein